MREGYKETTKGREKREEEEEEGKKREGEKKRWRSLVREPLR